MSKLSSTNYPNASGPPEKSGGLTQDEYYYVLAYTLLIKLQNKISTLSSDHVNDIKPRRRETLWRASLKVTIATGITSSHSEQRS